MKKPRVRFRFLLLTFAGIVMAPPSGACFCQADEAKENVAGQLQILLRTEALDVISPELRDSAKVLREEPLLPPGAPTPESENPHPILPHFQRPMDGRPGFMPPVMLRNRLQQHHGPGRQVDQPEIDLPEFHHPGPSGREMHRPERPFAEDQRRIAALTESAERLAQAGLPDIAHELRERAEHLGRELAEKQERMQREQQARMREQQEHARQEHQRMMEQRRDGIEIGDHPPLPLRELHEQLAQLRREVHSINQKVSHLTEMIEHHHRAQARRGHREHMHDDEDRDDDSGEEMRDGDDDDQSDE